ncbi:hypothetical protein D3C71_1890220 [compost metagenome]
MDDGPIIGHGRESDIALAVDDADLCLVTKSGQDPAFYLCFVKPDGHPLRVEMDAVGEGLRSVARRVPEQEAIEGIGQQHRDRSDENDTEDHPQRVDDKQSSPEATRPAKRLGGHSLVRVH